MAEPFKPRVVLYARALPRGRAGTIHLAPSKQLERLRAWAEGLGMQIVGEYADDLGATDSPELAKAVGSFGRHGGGVLAAYDVSRLGSSLDAACWCHILALQQTRLALLEPDPGVDPVHMRLLTRCETIRLTVRDLRNGRDPAARGDAPPKPAKRDHSPKTIAKILKMRAEGLGYQVIAEALTERGVRPCGADAWTAEGVRSVVRRHGSQ